MFNTRTQKIAMVVLAGLIGAGLLISPSQGQKLSPYFGGEAIEHEGTVYIGTADTGRFELFSLEEGELYKKADMISPAGEKMPFADMTFSRENGELYVYLVNGEYFYKYSLDTPEAPVMEWEKKDNSYYSYNGVKKERDKVVTVSDKGLRIHRENGTLIGTRDIDTNVAANVSFSEGEDFIFNVLEGRIEIRDGFTGDVASEVEYFDSSEGERRRKVYNDGEESLLYVADDLFVRALDFQGNTVKQFRHVSDRGYDVVPSADPRFIYFSDGHGVVKADKRDLSPVEWKFTTGLAGGDGWAMGIDTVGSGNEEKVVVFNHSSIAVLDNNMEVVDHVEAGKDNFEPLEPMYLKVDKNRAAPGSKISLRGGGFGLHEDLKITFAKKELQVRADGEGKFSRIMEVPDVLPGKTDIKVEGERTDRSYSTGFEVE